MTAEQIYTQIYQQVRKRWPEAYTESMPPVIAGGKLFTRLRVNGHSMAILTAEEGMRAIEEIMARLEWTTATPTTDGWYWHGELYTGGRIFRTRVCRIYVKRGEVFQLTEHGCAVQPSGGVWAGPIPEPALPKELVV